MYRYTYDEIANKYIDTIYRLALSRTNSHQYAEDITQEVFLKLMSNRKQFESEEHLKAWLLRVTINLTKDLFSSAWFRKTSELDENLSYTHEEESDLYYALAKLPQKYRTVIHLHYYEGYQIDEIAKITNASVGTVKSQLHRGRQMLKSILEGDESIG
jgi:RNA polymerase sigma-70 factor (ECF subfamily)